MTSARACFVWHSPIWKLFIRVQKNSPFPPHPQKINQKLLQADNPELQHLLLQLFMFFFSTFALATFPVDPSRHDPKTQGDWHSIIHQLASAVDHGGLGGITWGYVYSRFNSLSLTTNQPLVENIVARKALDFLFIYT